MLQLNSDCLLQIFNELRDKKSLHSCLLVNREWCHLAIPILWKKYFWQIYGSCSDMFLYWLPSSSKQLLYFNNIQLPSTNLSKPPLFDYISFCEFPEPRFIMMITKKVLKKYNEHIINDTNRKNILEREIYKLFVSQCKSIKKLHWETSQALSTFPGASTCFSHLCTLNVNINHVKSSALYEMAKFCKNLNALIIYNHNIYEMEDFSGLISLIDVQRNLKRVRLDERIITHEEIGKALARKGNTINNLCLSLVCAIPPLFLTSLINLEKLSIHYRKKTNEFHRLSLFKEISVLIERNKGNVSYIHIDANIAAKYTRMLIKAISNNCPNIKYLCTYHEPEDFTYMKPLLLNCRYIRYLKLNSFNSLTYYNHYPGDELLDILTEFSPKSLVSVRIGNWKYSIGAFERFFKNYNERTLRCFDITYPYSFITKYHRVIITKYINKRVIKESNCRLKVFH